MAQENGLLTPEEAAEFLKVDIRTIYRWLRKGVLVGVKIGDSWRIRRSDIDAFWRRKNSAHLF